MPASCAQAWCWYTLPVYRETEDEYGTEQKIYHVIWELAVSMDWFVPTKQARERNLKQIMGSLLCLEETQ